MRRLKKKIFLGIFGGTVLLLGAVRLAFPDVAQPIGSDETTTVKSADLTREVAKLNVDSLPTKHVKFEEQSEVADSATQSVSPNPPAKWHPVRSVHSYAACFPDLQDVQIVAAQQWGVPSIADRKEAEQRKKELVYAGASPYYDIDPRMNRSIPYLVPRASVLLQRIGRSFMDSLCVKGVPMHKIIVSSVLRTEEDVKRLRRHNVNATEQSAHCHGTTFDITYARFTPVTAHEAGQDTLKMILAEVLRDFRENQQCYIKYERKQGCFHITVR